MAEELFDDYARVFAKFTTPYQQETYELITPYLRGRVLDAGCGCGKLAAYIPGIGDVNVNAYVGVDFSAPMVAEGEKLLASIARRNFEIRLQHIEHTAEEFDTVVSVQSYYSWSDSYQNLKHLFERTAAGGQLIIATANDRLDIELLIRQCSRGWLLHPDWPRYVGYNRQLASLPGGRYVTLDTLIGEVRQCGYEVTYTNTLLFDGGVNMVIAKKPHGKKRMH